MYCAYHASPGCHYVGLISQTVLHVALQYWPVSKSGTGGQSRVINANSFIIQTSISARSRWIFLMDRWWHSLPFGQMGWSGWSGFSKDEIWVFNHVLSSPFGWVWLSALHGCDPAALPHPALVPASSWCCICARIIRRAKCRWDTLNTAVL